MMKEFDVGMTREEFIAECEELLTPIDFEALIGSGQLEKVGAKYRALVDIKTLPRHVTRNIKTISWTKKGTLLTFRKPSKGLAKMVEKMKRG
jgi:hypothetical protein